MYKINKDKISQMQINLGKNVILRYIEGDPPILFNIKEENFIVISKDLAILLKISEKGLKLDEVLRKLSINKKEEIEELLTVLETLYKHKWINIHYVYQC